MICQAWSCKMLVLKGYQPYPKATTQIVSSTYFHHPRPPQTCGTAFSQMVTDNLSGAKGTTQSSATIAPSLDSSTSLSGTSWHHPIANPLVSQPHQWHPIMLDYLSPLFCTFSTRAPGSVFILIHAFIHYRDLHYYYYFIIIIIIYARIVTLFCIVLSCNLG